MLDWCWLIWFFGLYLEVWTSMMMFLDADVRKP